MMEGKRLIFTVSPGRCGTRYLAEMLRTVPGVAAEHEPKPGFEDAARLAQFVPEAARKFWREHKLPTIAQYDEYHTYIETGHVFANGFAEALLEVDEVADLIVLTRPAREVALSRWRRGSVPVKTERGSQYTIHPNARGVQLPVNGWQKWTDYQLIYWFCLEVEARGHRYARMYEDAGAMVYETSMKYLTTECGFLALLAALDLPEPDMDAYRAIAGRHYNATPEGRLVWTPEGDLDEQEQEVHDAIDDYTPEERDKPSVHIFLINTGSVREELSHWREVWKADRRFDVKVEGSRGFPVCDNRGRAVLKFLAGGCDYMVMIDADVVPQRNIIDLVEHDLDVVCFPTPIWRPTKSPQMPMLLNLTLLEKDGSPMDRLIEISEMDELHPISSGGTGCLMIARRVLEHPALFHPFQDLWRFDGTRSIGNDIWFVRRAIAAGFKAWGAMRYPCAHFKRIDLLQAQMTYDELIKGGQYAVV